MACSRKRTNPFSDCNDEQEQDEDIDEYSSKNSNNINSSGFLHDNYPPSYHADHQIQTSSSNNNSIINDNGNGIGNTNGAESSNAAAAHHHQNLSNGRTNHQNQVQQELGGSVFGLRLSFNIMDLVREIRLRLTHEKDQQQVLLSDQPAAELPPQMKLNASNIPALYLRIGSWEWEAKKPLDLAAKFYYKKRKVVWEFLFRPLKKKIEIRWSDISAINAYVDDQDNTGRLEIQLNKPPKYYKEPKSVPKKHTQWDTTTDFTQGQAQIFRRHTIIFSPGALDEHLEKLLQLDNRLFNLSRQPFPIHDDHFFNINTIINNNNNTMAFPYNLVDTSLPASIPLSNYHPGAIDLQNLVQPATTPFVEHSNLQVPLSINNDHHPETIDAQNLLQPVDNSNSPVPLSIDNNDHHPGTIDVQNLVQPATTSFIGYSNLPVPLSFNNGHHPGTIDAQNLVQPVENSNSPVPLSIDNNDHHPGTIDVQNLVQPATTPFIGYSNLPVPLSINNGHHPGTIDVQNLVQPVDNSKSPVPVSVDNNDHHPGTIDVQNLVQPATTPFVGHSKSPVPLSINNDHHQGTIDAQNLVQHETTSFVGHSNLPMLGVTTLPNLDENASEFSHVITENTNGVGEEETGGNNQIQDISAALPPPTGGEQDAFNDDQIYEELESFIQDPELQFHGLVEDIPAEVNVAQQNCFKLDHQNNSISLEAKTDGAGGMQYHMASIYDNDNFSFTGLQYNDDELAFQQEPCYNLWSSQYYNDINNGDNDDQLPLQGFSFGGASSSGN